LPASNPEDVERTYFELKKNGVEFSEGLTTTDWGKYAILRDPDGNEFEISESKDSMTSKINGRTISYLNAPSA